jgi:hypothetical protein
VAESQNSELKRIEKQVMTSTQTKELMLRVIERTISEPERGQLIDLIKDPIAEGTKPETVVRMYDLHHRLILAKTLQDRGFSDVSALFSADYLDRGFRTGTLSSGVADPLVESLKKAAVVPIQHEDYAPGYMHHPDLRPYEEKLNRDHRYLYLGPEQIQRCAPMLEELASPLSEFTGLPWRTINLRAWRTLPHAAESGPTDWHLDGFPLSTFKIMVYISAASETLGTTQIKLKDGSIQSVEGPPGTWNIFRNSELYHRGTVPKIGERIILEITIAAAWKQETTPAIAGLNASYPRLPWFEVPESYRPRSGIGAGQPPEKNTSTGAAKRNLGAFGGVKFLNIGGGPGFNSKDWMNLEAVASPSNPTPFHFHETCDFPVTSNSVSLTYSSHTLEHLNDPTVARVLEETRRALHSKGQLVLKIPDFDLVLESWAKRNEEFFDKYWNLGSCINTWSRRGIPASVDYKAIMIFVGIWNDHYGNPFAGGSGQHPLAYHGPPPIGLKEFNELAKSRSPKIISSQLKQFVLDNERDYHFNHQNAWNLRELECLLISSGFSIISFDKQKIVSTCGQIPGIEDSIDFSLYCLAERY